MTTLRFLLQKEFRQIFRNPTILKIIFVMPIIQLLLLPWAANYEVKNIQLALIDHDQCDYSRQLISKISASGYFKIQSYVDSYKKSLKDIESDRADIVVEIPASFEKDLVRNNEASVALSVNAINGVKALLGSSYLQIILQDFNTEIRSKWTRQSRFKSQTTIDIQTSNWFNPYMNYKFFMVPGILVVLLTMVGSFLASLNIVKEKEVGTIEQINVTPIKKFHFILGKLIPFWILGLIILTIGLLIAWLFYGITPAGSFLTIYLFAAVYLLAVLGLGLLVSTYCATQQQAMLISFFLLMVFVLLGGLFTPIDSMPAWAQLITKLNPVSYFIEVIRMVILKGSSLIDIRYHLFAIMVFAVVLNGWAVLNYRKRS